MIALHYEPEILVGLPGSCYTADVFRQVNNSPCMIIMKMGEKHSTDRYTFMLQYGSNVLAGHLAASAKETFNQNTPVCAVGITGI